MMPPYKWKVTIKGKREIRQRPQDQEAKASSHLSTKVQSIRDFSIVVVSDLLLQVNPIKKSKEKYKYKRKKNLFKSSGNMNALLYIITQKHKHYT